MKRIMGIGVLCMLPISGMAQLEGNESSVVNDVPPTVGEAPSPTIEPGLWKIKMTTEDDAKNGPSTGMREMTICYTPERVAEELNTQLKPADNASLLPNMKCRDKSGPAVEGQRIQREAECQTTDGKVTAVVASDCTYAGTTLRCRSSMSNGTETLITVIEGERVGECPAAK